MNTVEGTTTAVGNLSKRQAAEYLGISERKLQSLTVSGEIPAARIGRRVLYRLRDLERFTEKAIRRAS